MLPGNCTICERPLTNRPLVNRGTQARLQVNNKTTIVDLKAISGCVCGEVLAACISLEDCESSLDDSILVMPRGYISWGIGSAAFYATIDLYNGVCVAVPADTLTIEGELFAFQRLGVPPTTDTICIDDVLVKAGIAYGDGNFNPAPRLTEVVQIPVGEGPVRIKIPRFATSFTIVPIGASTVTVEAITFGTGFSPRYVAVGPLSNLAQHNTVYSFPLVNGTRCLEVSGSLTEDVTAFIIFNLSF